MSAEQAIKFDLYRMGIRPENVQVIKQVSRGGDQIHLLSCVMGPTGQMVIEAHTSRSRMDMDTLSIDVSMRDHAVTVVTVSDERWSTPRSGSPIEAVLEGLLQLMMVNGRCWTDDLPVILAVVREHLSEAMIEDDVNNYPLDHLDSVVDAAYRLLDQGILPGQVGLAIVERTDSLTRESAK